MAVCCCGTCVLTKCSALLPQVEELSEEREQLCSTVQAQAAQVDALQAEVAALQVQRDQALDSSRRAGSDLDAALDSSHKMIKQVCSSGHSCCATTACSRGWHLPVAWLQQAAHCSHWRPTKQQHAGRIPQHAMLLIWL